MIVYKNQSAKTEEMNNCAMKSIINFLGDIPVADLSFDAVRKWTADLRKTQTSNTVRGYTLKIHVVLKHLRALGYEDILDPEAVGIPKRDSRVVDYLEVEEVQVILKTVFHKGAGYSKFKRYRNRAIIAPILSAGLRNGELCSMERSQIKDDIYSFTVIGKGDKPRGCFIDPVAYKYIDEYLALRDNTRTRRSLFPSSKKVGRK